MGAAQETKMVKRIFLFVIIPIIIYSIGIVKLNAMINGTEAKIATEISQIKNYYTGGFAMPNQEVIEAQKAVLEEARTTVGSILSYSCAPVLEMPADVQEYGVYFKERLYLTEKKLRTAAKRLNILFPEDIGFNDELPSESHVPFMIMQLEFVENVLMKIIQSNVKKVQLIEFEASDVLYNANEEKMPCQNITLKVSMNCSLSALKKVLYEIGNMNPFVVVGGLKVKQLNNETLEVHMLITRLVEES